MRMSYHSFNGQEWEKFYGKESFTVLRMSLRDQPNLVIIDINFFSDYVNLACSVAIVYEESQCLCTGKGHRQVA